MEFLTKQSTANNSVLKIVAAFLFVALPILGFILGMKYQESVNPENQYSFFSRSMPVAINNTDKTSAWKTYINKKYNYAIDYPNDWIVRESPDSKTGAAFQPANKPIDYKNETIKINVSQKVMSDKPISSFEEYAKVAATLEIQSYIKLASFKKVTTSAGLTGYKTTWIVGSPPIINVPSVKATTSESSPITYFEIPNNTTSLLQATLGGEQDSAVYEKMINTVRFSNTLSSMP
jgi:hypothetical protein